jgi:hypothetical protein
MKFLRNILSIVAFFCGAGVIFAQAPGPATPTDLKPNENQELRLKNAQLEAKLAQTNLQNFCGTQQQPGQLQSAFDTARDKLISEGEKVKAENKWDAKVSFNPYTLTFSAPPPPTPAPPAPATKKP